MNNDAMEKLTADLHKDSQITGHRAQIEIQVDNGAVRLIGDAHHIAAKRRAVALAEQHFGGDTRIVDLLHRDVTRQLSDAQLARTVGDRLAEEPVFTGHGLEVGNGDPVELRGSSGGGYALRVTARDGVVTLSGSVGSLTHRRLAEVVAWWTGATRSVVNELDVDPPEEDNDNELTDAVRMTLEKDPLVDAGQLRIGTAGGIVHVEGLLRNDEQREAVLDDIWLVPGVVDVVDRIAARHL